MVDLSVSVSLSNLLQCVAACCSVLQVWGGLCDMDDLSIPLSLSSVLQHVAVFCSVLQCAAVHCSVLRVRTPCMYTISSSNAILLYSHFGTRNMGSWDWAVGTGAGNPVVFRGLSSSR